MTDLTDRNNINISKIESYFKDTLLKGLSDQVFVGTLPDVVSNRWNDMVLIDCANAIQDLNAYGKGTILVWLYAKPLANTLKNVKVMGMLETKLNEILSNTKLDAHYRVNRRNTFQDFDPNVKWHCNIVELNLIII